LRDLQQGCRNGRRFDPATAQHQRLVTSAGGLVAWLLGLGTLVAVAAGGRAVARRREP